MLGPTGKKADYRCDFSQTCMPALIGGMCVQAEIAHRCVVRNEGSQGAR